MQTRTKGLLAGAVIGALTAGIFAIPSALPPSMAQEEPAATLLKTGEQLFREPVDGLAFVKPPQRFVVEPWVSTDVTKRQTVRKIGYGKTEFVDILTTATGTYSSDGFDSTHVRYPGVHANPAYKDWVSSTKIAVLSGGAWVVVQNSNANSFVDIIPFEGGRLGIREDGSACVKVDSAMYC
jgi:hypothetical protein